MISDISSTNIYLTLLNIYDSSTKLPGGTLNYFLECNNLKSIVSCGWGEMGGMGWEWWGEVKWFLN